MKYMRQMLFWISGTAMFVFCGFISLFLLASGYESIFNRSLPAVHTIEKIDLQAFAQSYDLEAAAVQDEDRYGNFGKPQNIRLPGRESRLDIVPPLRESTSWLARANTLHLLTPEKPRSGNLGIALLYCRASFRTITGDALPEEGDNIFMDTDRSWRYVYRVTSASVAPASQPYVIADGGDTAKLLISCHDEGAALNIYIEADLLSVQGMTL